jgi:hypothetical protein
MEDMLVILGIGSLMMLPLIAGGITFVLSAQATEDDK